MLQILTGKFFTSDELYVTRQRGVLYSNYQLREPIETVVGALLPAEPGRGVANLIYEVDQRLEARDAKGERSILKAVNADYLIEDFAAVASFALNVTCTPDLDLARRLTEAAHPALGISKTPGRYVGRVFEGRIESRSEDKQSLQVFCKALVGLERRAYEAAMRAIRRFVVGLHRIGDDLDLAYTLLVASVESLAQDFDEFTPTWIDYDQKKRSDVDRTLKHVPEETASEVRAAILKNEHVALGRRFREFALSHLSSSFFREEAVEAHRPAPRPVLEAALKQAYRLRSSYVHTLRELPRVLTAVPSHADCVLIEQRLVLTLHGLARVARHVIKEFVSRGTKVEWEDFDYRRRLPNIVWFEPDESVQLGNREGYNHKSARRYLSAFIDKLLRTPGSKPSSAVEDVKPVVEEIELQVKGLALPEQRRPMLALYSLYHYFASPEVRRSNWERFVAKYEGDFEAPSIEEMAVHVLTESDLDWTLEQFERVWSDYLAQRDRRNGISLHRLFETATILIRAEWHRRASDVDGARKLIAEAVENLPGHVRLLEFEQRFLTTGHFAMGREAAR